MTKYHRLGSFNSGDLFFTVWRLEVPHLGDIRGHIWGFLFSRMAVICLLTVSLQEEVEGVREKQKQREQEENNEG